MQAPIMAPAPQYLAPAPVAVAPAPVMAPMAAPVMPVATAAPAMAPQQQQMVPPGPRPVMPAQPVEPKPRGYFRGPLALPGRKPVRLNSYRKAAKRATEIKHRDQARDMCVLQRNRRAQQVAAGAQPATQVAPQPMIAQQAAPLMLEAPPVVAPLAIEAPPMYASAPAFAQATPAFAPAFAGAAAPVYY